MSNKDLINLGISPDSGTGDSARRGGEKINTLFADVYSQFGDNPVGQDPSQPFYGYRQPFFEYEYKVGELHPAGRYVPIEFKTPAVNLAYDSEWGWGHDNTGAIVDTDGDGIPDIYRDSEWYFLSRGEQIDADLTNVDPERSVHFVLPIGVPGDQVVIRDGFSTWKNNIFINIWTTPYEFSSIDQINEWKTNTGYMAGVGYPDSDSISIYSPTEGARYRSNWHKFKPDASIQNVYGKTSQPFSLSRTTNPYQGLSPTYYQNIRRYQLEFLYTSYEEGWLVRQVVLDSADISAVVNQLSGRMDGIDSDLSAGIYVSADSDIRHSVPLLRRTPDGREIHGNIKFLGDNDSIMTAIDSEDAVLRDERNINDPDSAVQPYTTTIKFRLRDNVRVKDNLTVGGDFTLGQTLRVGSGNQNHVTIDSDLTNIRNRLTVRELAQFDSDVNIDGQLTVAESSTFSSDTRFDRNIVVEGDANLHGQVRIFDNLIPLNANNDNANNEDTGFIFQRWDQTAGGGITPLTSSDTIYNPYLIWNEASDRFMVGETVSSDSESTTILAKERTYMAVGRGEFVLFDSENTPRVVFEKAYGWPSDVKSAIAGSNPNERPTVEPDYEFHVKANTVLGRDSDDVVVFNSRIMSNLVPFGDETFSLGDSDNKWRDLYLGGNTIYLGSIKIKDQNGTIVFVDSDDNVITQSVKNIQSASINIDSELSVGGNALILGRLTVNDHASFDSDVAISGNLVVGDHVTLSGRTRILEGLTVDSDTFLGADLHVDSDLIVKGQSTFGEQVRIDDTLFVKDNATFDSDVFIRGNLTVNDHIVLGGRVLINEGLTVDSDVTISADLNVDSDAVIKGRLLVGENTTLNDTLYVKGRATFDSDVFITGAIRSGQEVTFADDVFFQDNAVFDSDVIIRGSLTVNGATTTVSAANLAVGDNFIVLNRNQATPVNDTGIIFTRYDSDNVSTANYNAVLEWDETQDRFILGETNNSGIDSNPAATGRYVTFSRQGIQTDHSLTVGESVTIDSDLSVTGTVAIPGYPSVSHHLGTIDSDLLKVQQRLDSDELAIQAAKTYLENRIDSEYREMKNHYNYVLGRLDSDQAFIQDTATRLENLLDSEYNKNRDWFAYAQQKFDSDSLAIQTNLTFVQNLLDSEYVKNRDAAVNIAARLDSDEVAIQANLTYLENRLDSEYVKNAQMLSYIEGRLDSDEIMLQALRVRVAGDSDIMHPMPLDGTLKIQSQDDSIKTTVSQVGTDVIVEIEVGVLNGGTF